MYQTKQQSIRSVLVGGAAIIAITSSAAYAQGTADSSETVVVSSTRITTAGFDAPTPTTVLGSDYLVNRARDNVFDAIKELPSLLGSTGQQVGNNGTSGGGNGISSFNMFGLGTIRTLTLLDGQRVVPANVTGIPDISMFPQLLIDRVDVVTGGASASWGSDALAGVVNFVTNKRFEGFKANISAGVSTYGDNTGGTVQMAAGTSFLGGRGHLQVAAEYSHTDGVGITQKQGCCEDALAGGRRWFISPTRLQYASPAATPNPGGGANTWWPQYNNVSVGQHFQLARYGMITNGPKQGTAFLDNGTPYAFVYGKGLNGLQGVPVGNAAGTVTNCVNPFCIGGQTDGIIGAGVTLAFPLTRGGIYTRVSYEITPDINVWATLNWASVATSNIPNPDAWRTDFTIRCDNAYLPATGIFGAGLTPAQTQAACLAAYPTTTYPNGMAFGSDFHNLGPQTVYTQRNQRRAVVGADGAFNLLGSDWTWSTYFQHGENNTHIKVRQITMLPHFRAAVDSIIDPAQTRWSAAMSLRGRMAVSPLILSAMSSRLKGNWIICMAANSMVLALTRSHSRSKMSSASASTDRHSRSGRARFRSRPASTIVTKTTMCMPMPVVMARNLFRVFRSIPA